jgi:hypothetical protein
MHTKPRVTRSLKRVMREAFPDIGPPSARNGLAAHSQAAPLRRLRPLHRQALQGPSYRWPVSLQKSRRSPEVRARPSEHHRGPTAKMGCLEKGIRQPLPQQSMKPSVHPWLRGLGSRLRWPA